MAGLVALVVLIKGEERIISAREESLMSADLGTLITGMEG